MHPREVFTTLQFTSYRCYGEGEKRITLFREEKRKKKEKFQRFCYYRLHSFSKQKNKTNELPNVYLQ